MKSDFISLYGKHGHSPAKYVGTKILLISSGFELIAYGIAILHQKRAGLVLQPAYVHATVKRHIRGMRGKLPCYP